MKKNDVQLLMIVLGILLCVVAWQFVYNPNVEKTEALEAENAGLQEIVTKLEGMEAQKETYLKDTEELQARATEIMDHFPAGSLMEDEIMYLYNMENVKNNHVVVPNIGLGVPTEEPYSGTLTVDEYELTDDGIRLMTTQDNITFTTNYTGLKNVVRYVYEIPGRKSISTISLAAGNDGYLSGTMSVNFYALEGTEKLYAQPDIPGVRLGKKNIFGSVQTGQGSAE